MARSTLSLNLDFTWAATPQEANDVVRPAAQLLLTGFDDSYVVDNGNKPLQEHINYLLQTITSNIHELNQRGIFEWNARTAFEAPCACLLEGKIYFSRPGVSPGKNVDPRQTNTVWTKGWAPGDDIPVTELPTVDVAHGGTGRTDGANLVPSGGSRHYVLRKASNSDHDTEWGEIVIPNMPVISDAQDPISVIVRTANYAVQPTDNNALILMGTGSGDRTLSLPSLDSGDTGFLIRAAKSTSSNTLVIDPNGADRIAGLGAYSLRRLWESVTLAWSGTTWIVLAHRVNYGTNEGDVPRLGGGGLINLDTIPNLPADRTNSGEFDEDRIPNHSTDKLTRGLLPLSRGGTGRTDGANLVPGGGTRHYVLRKGSNADYDTEWGEIVIPNMPTLPDSQDAISVIVRTANYAVQPTDNNALIVMGTGSGDRTLSLPSLDSGDTGFLIRAAKSTSSNTLVIDPNGADRIAGLSAYSLRRLWESVTLAWSGTTWIVLAHRVNYGTNEGDVPRLGGGGLINLDTIPNLPADRTNSGEFDEDRIPNHSTDKLTRGLLPLSRGGLNADTAAGGRATLQLGTAAREDVGTGQDDVARARTVAPAGMMGAYAGGVVPDGWLLADGRAISRTTYSDLYAAIGTTWGPGDGNTTFNLPNTQERFLLGKSATKAVGDTGGESEHTLTSNEIPAHRHTLPSHRHSIPSHTHSYTPTISTASAMTPSGSTHNVVSGLGIGGQPQTTGSGGGGNTTFGGGGSTGNRGNGRPHNNMPPYAVVLYIIKT